MNQDFIPLRIVVLMNKISEEEWRAFSKALHMLPQPPHITLVKILPTFPDRFYQLPEMFITQNQAITQAKKSFSQIERYFNFPVPQGVIFENQFATWLRQWEKQDDCVVLGKKTVMEKLSSYNRSKKIIDITQWLAFFEKLAIHEHDLPHHITPKRLN